ncbi:MAG: hypothetical protein JXQ83_06950 [Candidatus Glassbacteria bacterium]|nr:hypothetical protein [Candidatus Glassbacteria bacterium]
MHSNLFGQFLLECGAIDSDQLKQALDYQRAHNRVLGELAVEKGLLNETAISRIIERQRVVDKDFGGIAVELGLLSEKTLDELLREQQRSHLRLGDVLVKLDILDQRDLKKQLEDFKALHGEETPETLDEEQLFAENPGLGFFNLTSRILPRMTRGLFFPGGFYPTIAYSEYRYGIGQQVQGDLDMEGVLIMSPEIFSLLGGSVVGSNGRAGESRSKPQYESSIKSMLDIIMRLFIQQQEKFGVKLELRSAPKKISEKAFQKRRQGASATNLVEVFLISPHDPSGDLLEFYMCALFK